jgi:folate-binding protein YgfZ
MLQTNPGIAESRPLSGLTLVTFAGPDATDFLQGQLTQDLRRVAGNDTCLAASNTAQGRVISVLHLRSAGGTIHALVAADVADALVAQLRRYVLRAKVTIAIDRGARIIGRSRAQTDAIADPVGLAFQWGTGREVLVEPSREPPGASSAPTTVGDRAIRDDRDWNRWLAADIADGLPHVNAAASGHFVAQMLNLDLLDAIGFSKGCYTGQEIVARTQNLGRIKRRLLRYEVATGDLPATLAPLRRAGAKVGEVLQSASTGDRNELLAVVSLDARDDVLELEDGRTAEPRALPYSV